ncbi:MAG TPA: helix-turn-helix domain-containing protein [Kofleriaceae bacterium]|nr:helix-turn-helix domain-containing protein [Kofleriaceae bacterium]
MLLSTRESDPSHVAFTGWRLRVTRSIEDELAAHWQAGAAAWPGIVVAADRFASEVTRRSGDAVAAACGADLYLAIACSDGDATAIERCEQLARAEIEHVGRRLRATPDQAAEVAAQLSRVLFVDEPERPAAVREFSGRGNLRAYVRVMATRDLIRAINRGRRETPIGEDEILDRLATHRDPELSILRAQYHGVVDDAMRAALGTLDKRARALLRYQLVDGWNIDQVGRVYGVHRATAARWIEAARETLGKAIRGELGKRLAIDPSEVASIVRLVQSRVDVSLDRLLGARR